jgi:small Trp-rich protein
MILLIIGVLLLAAKMAGIGPTAEWSWWIVLAPFAGAVVWWQISDSLGLTQKRAIQRMEDRKEDRRRKAMVSLGLVDAKGRSRREPAPPPAPKAEAGRADKPAAEAPPPRRDPRL